MIRTVMPKTWFIDLEWVPDVETGRRAYSMPASASDAEVLERMWGEAGATPENPQPYLKTSLCRIVAATALVRTVDEAGAVDLKLCSIPRIGEGAVDERSLLERFFAGLEKQTADPRVRGLSKFELEAVRRDAPQIVGFNIAGSDIPILLQRGIANGVVAPKFSWRPDKPWEGKDYFASKGSDFLVDLCAVLGGWGNARPSLNELAAACGIPGKLGTSGADVIDLWLAGRIDEIVEYNQYDVLTTYLLWLRAVRFAGLLSPQQVSEEEGQLQEQLRARSRTESHLQTYLGAWRN